MRDLTQDQTYAITNAWLDLTATRDMLNGDGPMDRRSWEEMSIATTATVEELEKEFPFVLKG